jgi:hypothetical protein
VKSVVLAAGSGLDPNSISPGLIGFLATFGVVVVSILLFVNMSRRLRRMRYREERDAQERARLAGREGRPPDAPDPDGSPRTEPRDGG